MSPALAALAIAPSAFGPLDGMPALETVDSLETLRREVERWGEAALPEGGPEDINDVVDWLDRNFYRFDA